MSEEEFWPLLPPKDPSSNDPILFHSLILHAIFPFMYLPDLHTKRLSMSTNVNPAVLCLLKSSALAKNLLHVVGPEYLLNLRDITA